MGMASIAHVSPRHSTVVNYTSMMFESGTGPQTTPLPNAWSGTFIDDIESLFKTLRGGRVLSHTIDTGTATSVAESRYAWGEEYPQTTVSSNNGSMILLEESAHAGDHRMFRALVKAIDWSTRRPDELTTAIDLALGLAIADLAIQLAQLGKRLFPDHRRVQQAARVLAPPVARIARLPRAKGLDASRAWLHEHAGQYRGQWVAVRNGQLLGTAESLAKLETITDLAKEPTSTIITKVL